MLASSLRLGKQHGFTEVLRYGKRSAYGEYILFYQPNQLPISRFGFIAGKKILPKASGRNRAKRVSREAIRTLLPHIRPGYDIILMYRYKPDRFAFQGSLRVLRTLFASAHLLKPAP